MEPNSLTHLKKHRDRKTTALPVFQGSGWKIKRYAICADGRSIDPPVVEAAVGSAIERLPLPGQLSDPNSNHGVALQIVHFAEVAVVSPIFIWQWGSVLANILQIRANWETPTKFNDGVAGVVGCVWEMKVVSFEVSAWTETMLSGHGDARDNLENYLRTTLG